YWLRAAEPCLFPCCRPLLAPHEGPVPIACRRAGESPRGGRVRPGREPPVEFRSLAARTAALAEALPALHGEVRAPLVAARLAHLGRGRLPGTARRARPRGDRYRRAARSGGARRGDVSARDASAEGTREEVSAEGA